MMTESQHTEIRNYLLGKKLPIDILMEVEDHFISQINEVMKEKNISFEAAFETVKVSWDKELQINYSINNIPQTRLVKSILRKQNIAFFKKSVQVFLPFLIISVLLANFSSAAVFKIFFSVFLIAVVLLPLFNHFSNYQTIRLADRYKNIQLSVLQNVSRGASVAVFYVFILFSDITRKSEQFYYILNGNYRRILDVDQRNSTILCGITFAVIFWSIFFSKKQLVYIKKLKEVKPFLQYLKMPG